MFSVERKEHVKMKKYLLLITALLIVALLAMASPALADRNAPVGDRIGLFFGGSREFMAGAPFHVRHGWIQSSEDNAIGVFDFALDVDGILQREDFKMFSAVSGDPDLLNRIWVYNFPNGMTGTHTFTGHWFAPCQYAVDFLAYPGPCATPNEKVETNTRTLIVTFFP
jgi:hypothetical protein